MKQVAARLRLDMAQYRELAAFAQFGSDLDKATQDQLNRGQRMQEILKQPQYSPMSLEDLVVVLYAGTNGYADKVQVERIKAWEVALLRYLNNTYPEVGKSIAENKSIIKENETLLRQALDSFRATWQ
jgi:F-type H+-transporting ATPase subunit alpha